MVPSRMVCLVARQHQLLRPLFADGDDGDGVGHSLGLSRVLAWHQQGVVVQCVQTLGSPQHSFERVARLHLYPTLSLQYPRTQSLPTFPTEKRGGVTFLHIAFFFPLLWRCVAGHHDNKALPGYPTARTSTKIAHNLHTTNTRTTTYHCLRVRYSIKTLGSLRTC